jgi:sensor histidine kinase YesM
MEQHPEIKINFDIEEDLPNVIVPQLCILALVDNSVTYAFDAVLQPRVKVTIYQDIDDNMIHISVIDNGNGMSLEDAKVALVIPNKHLSIGLYHINQQLLDMGGTGLNINTGHRKGTQISFAVGINEVEVQNEF